LFPLFLQAQADPAAIVSYPTEDNEQVIKVTLTPFFQREAKNA